MRYKISEVVYESIYFSTEGGKELVRVWIENNFRKKEREKIKGDILFVAKHFPNVPSRDMICKISGYEGLWEIRIRLRNKTQVRILFFEHGLDLVILHGFVKKTQKIPKRELKLAKERMQEYLNKEGNNNE